MRRLGAGSGEVVQRTVKQLSGGERRRVALALALGFADLVSARTGLRCNLLVLDEVSQAKNIFAGRICHIPFHHLLCRLFAVLLIDAYYLLKT